MSSLEVVSFFSDRTVDFKLNERSPELTFAQRESLTRALGFLPESIAQIHQVHGDRVLEASQAFPIVQPIPDADALVTSTPGVALTVRTADCLPVYIFDPVRRAIGLAHAGWRSTHLQIVVKTISLMQKNWGSSPTDMKVAFGPAIRSCCYEVGEEFEKNFPADVTARSGRKFFDVAAANRRQLRSAGVKDENIADSMECTCCDKQFFSYRREAEKAGRHLSLLMIRN